MTEGELEMDTIEIGILIKGKADAKCEITEDDTGNLSYWDDPTLELYAYRDAYEILVNSINEAIAGDSK